MERRNYWYIQLHPSKKHSREWYKDYGFSSGIEAVRTYVEELKIVGMGIWGEGWDDIRRFVKEARKGDRIFTWYSEGGKWYQAILELVEDKTYYTPGEDKEGERKLIKENDLKVEEVPRPDERVWFQLFRKVKVLKSYNEKKIDYSPRGTFAQIHKEEVREVIEKF